MIVNETDFHGMQAYKIVNDKIDFTILPELGGKIISYRYNGIEFFYSDINNIKKVRDDFKNILNIPNVSSFRKKYRYEHPLGGFKNWIAPQSFWDWPPFIDLEFGKYSINIHNDGKNARIEVESPICRESNIQLKYIASLSGLSDSINLKQQLINHGIDEINVGIWDVTQVAEQGKVIFAVSDKSVDVLNLVKSYDDVKYMEYANIDYAVIECLNKKEFKIGTRSSQNWILTLKEIGDCVYGYLKIFDKVPSDSKFGHDCITEVYDSERYSYFEVEVHSPLKNLAPQEKVSLNETWKIFQWDKKTDILSILQDVLKENILNLSIVE